MKQQVEIIDKKPFGYIVKNLSTNVIQLIPESELKRRIQWGIYEISGKFAIGFKFKR
jgi:hypothetical protein